MSQSSSGNASKARQQAFAAGRHDALASWLLGPGTADGHVVPAARRRAVSKQSGWISPVVVAGGKVCGTWALDGDRVPIGWFK